jgi:chemosensory pili system protein ChpA (sensor histidine kinase/response regulator)
MLSEDPEYLTDDITSTFHQSLFTLEILVSELPDDGSEMIEEEIKAPAVDEATGIVDLGAPVPDIIVEELEAHPDESVVEAEQQAEADAAEAAHAEAEAAVQHAEEQAAEEAESRALEEEEEHKEAVFDDEILEFFLEEAREIAEQSKDLLQKWRSNPADETSLTDLRRAFHTLKGSGRMSGAIDFGDYAWYIEDMLNDVIADKHTASDAIFDILDHAIVELPGFLDGLEKHDESDVDPDRWLAMVDALDADVEATPEPVEEAQEPEAEQIEPLTEEVMDEEVAAEAAEESTEEAIEEIALSEALSGLPVPLQSDTVRDIYTSEINQYLNDLGAEISGCMDKGSCPSSELLHRLIHTLRGSARSVGLEKMADAYEAIENQLNDLSARKRNLDTADISLLQSSHDLGLQLLDTLQQPAVPEESLLDAFAELADTAKQRTADMEGIVSAEAAAAEEAGPVVEEELDEELVEIFREEATDLLSRFHEALDGWREQPDSEEASAEIKRIFHTIKGGARSTGIMGVGNLAHNAETLLDDSEKAGNKIDDRLFDLIEEVHDTLLMMVERPLSNEFAGQAKELDDRLTGYLTAAPVKAAKKGKAAEVPAAEPEKVEELPVEEHAELALLNIKPTVEEELPEAQLAEPKKVSQNQIRVNADLLSTLANYAGEVSIARSRIQQMVTDFKDNLGELHNSIGRFQTQLRELEIQADTQILSTSGGDIESVEDDFDPLEFDRYTQLQFLSRNLSEGLNDLMMIQNGMDNFAGDVEMLLAEQSRLNTDLQEGLTQTRMVSFSTLLPRLRQLTRKTARELNKPVNLTVKGGEVELDRNVIDQIVPPLEHLIRNSIAHGVETAAVRTKRDKPKKGNLELIVRREGKDIIIEFGDDGRGLDLKKIQKKAIENKLIEKGLKLSDDDLANLIFLPGFSTADKVSQVAGRGVGMDVVQSDIKQLGGSVSLTTEANAGTRFFIRLPLTLSVTQAMLIAAGGRQFAIPLIAIQTITMAKTRDLITDSDGNRILKLGGQEFPYMALVERLGLMHHLEDEGKIPVLMLNTAAGQIAIGVDELLFATEIVVKPVGIQIASLDGVEGATIIGDGQVTLILDLVDLWHTRMVEHEYFDQASLVAELEQADQSHATIMVVDDSLTVRRVTERNLSKYNIETVLATDGMDAMEKLAEGVLPDVMLVDIEMPRMNGYEVTEAVRNDPHYKDIPIIIITSRSGAKHRNRAMELGASLYLTKPYQELELMEAINSLLPAESSRKISNMMEA